VTSHSFPTSYLRVETAVTSSYTWPILLRKYTGLNNILIQHKCECILHNLFYAQGNVYLKPEYDKHISIPVWYWALTCVRNTVYRSVSPKDVQLLVYVYSTQTEFFFTDGQQQNTTSGIRNITCWYTTC
jgi:hypothetical protein